MAWNGAKARWIRTLTSFHNNFDMGSYNLDIAYGYNDWGYGLTGTISGTGKVTVHSKSPAVSTFEMINGENTYTGGTHIYGGIVDSSGRATTSLRVYASNEESEVYNTANNLSTSQYYYTQSLGSGRITLENAVISNGNKQCITLRNELYVPEDCWGVLCAGSALASVKYFDILGKITGAGAIYISKDSGTVLIRNSENDYSGGTFIGTSPSILDTTYEAAIEIGADNCLGTGAVTLNDSKARLDLNGHKLAIGGLSSEAYLDKTPGGHSGNYLTDVYVYDGSTDQTATLTVSGGTEYIYAGKFTAEDGNQKLTDLVKTGSGTQTFMSELGPDLQLTVEGGTVKLSALKTADGTVVVAGGIMKTPEVHGGAITTDYTLTYAGTDYLDIMGGDYTVSAETSQPGTLRVDIGSTDDFTRFDLRAKPKFTPGLGFVDPNPVNGFDPSLDDYFILSYDNSAFGEYFATQALEDWLRVEDRERWDLTWYVDDANYGTSLVLEYHDNKVPEPASVLLLLFGMGFLFLRRRFRK